MGGGTETSSSTTGSANKDVNAAVSSLAKGLSTLYKPGSSTYVAPSGATTGAWANLMNAANNGQYAGGLAGAIGSYSNRAAGNEIGLNNPAYAAMRSGLQNDVTKAVNTSFNNSGMFGSDSNARGLAEGLTSALGTLDMQQIDRDYSRQAEASQMLPALFNASTLPGMLQQSVGAGMDADAQAKNLGQIDYLGRMTSVLNGTAGAGGQTTTQTTPSPGLLQLLLGAGLSVI